MNKNTKTLSYQLVDKGESMDKSLIKFFEIPEETSLDKLSWEEIDAIISPKKRHADFKFFTALLINRSSGQTISELGVNFIKKYYKQDLSFEKLLLCQKNLSNYNSSNVLKHDYYQDYEDFLFTTILTGNLKSQFGAMLVLVGAVEIENIYHPKPIKNTSNQSFVRDLYHYIWSKRNYSENSMAVCKLLLDSCDKGIPNRFEIWEVILKHTFKFHPQFVPEIWYMFSYLNEYKIVDKILELNKQNDIDDAEEKYLDFCKNPIFSFTTSERMEYNYNMFLKLSDGVATKETVNFNDKFREWSALTLIANIAMLRSKDNIESEVNLLRHLTYRTGRALRRFAEVTGFTIPNGFLCAGEKRNLWIEDKIHHFNFARKVSGQNFLSKKSLFYLEEMYPIIPFNYIVIQMLILAEKQTNNKKYRKMYQASILRMRNYKNLSLTVTCAIIYKNFFALELILEHIAEIKKWDIFITTVCFRLNQVKSIAELHNEWVTGLQIVLEIFYRTAPDEIINIMKTAISNLENRTSALKIFHYLVDTRKQNNLQSIGIKKVENYDQVVSMLNNPPPDLNANQASKILQYLIRQHNQNSKLIVKAYNLLVKIEPSLASHFNADVEFHIVRYNSNFKNGQQVVYATSNIWLVPAILENPVNKQTSRVAGPNYNELI